MEEGNALICNDYFLNSSCGAEATPMVHVLLAKGDELPDGADLPALAKRTTI